MLLSKMQSCVSSITPQLRRCVAKQAKQVGYKQHLTAERIWNDIMLSDTHTLNIRRPDSDTQNSVEGKDCHDTHLPYAGKLQNCYYDS